MSATNSILKPLRIGMIGGGTVGGGVYEIIMNRLGGSSSGAVPSKASTTTVAPNPSLRRPCVITKVCVRDLSKPRSFHLDDKLTTLTTDYQSILDDDDIELVVEVMGGTGLAKTIVEEALRKGKSVVTANKALIAENLDEIHAISLTAAESTEKSGCPPIFAYEAAVCGGIPIIQVLHSCYTGDVIYEVMGICNGTTNYMLGKMEEGSEYDEVLKEAQDLGYAEADPSADVEGWDVRAKVAILAKLAFGTTISPVQSIPCRGISQVTSTDFEYAKLLGCTIKLVGTARRLSKYGEHDGALSVYVSPTVVPLTHLLASARGSGNAVALTTANVGTASYTGPGAGRFPTANSVVADIVRIASSNATVNPFPTTSSSSGTDSMELDHDYSSMFYIRIPFCDGLGIIRKVGELAEVHGISIYSILQNPIKDRMVADFCVTTEECKASQMEAFCNDINNQDFARSYPLYMPLLMKLE